MKSDFAPTESEAIEPAQTEPALRESIPASATTLGILSRYAPDERGRWFGPPTGFFEECCEAAKKLNLRVVVFDAADVDFKAATFKPATFVNGRWKACAPEQWPSLVYDRAPVFDSSYTPAADKVRDRFVAAGVSFLNPLRFLRLAADKWETYQWLNRGGLALPQTDLLDEEKLPGYLSRFDQVYIKPRRGSQGMGVMEIVNLGEERYFIRTLTEQLATRGSASLWNVITTCMNRPANEEIPFLIQQGISPESTTSRRFPRFDLRVLMQKDSGLRWKLTGIVARVSQRDGPTANLTNGARSEEAQALLEVHYGRTKTRSILEQVHAASFSLCRRLDAELGSLGELGIDIIPDPAGRPWVIEINAKPGRNVFKRIAHSEDLPEGLRLRYLEIRKQSVSRPFEYAKRMTQEI